MKPMYINGKFTNGHATEEIQVQNPATYFNFPLKL
jgi:hypothetical protein